MGRSFTNGLQASVPSFRPTMFPYSRAKNRGFTKGDSRDLRPPQVFAALPNHEEWNLIQQAADGDSKALEQLFAVHRKRLHRIAFAILHNKEDAEDAVQEGLWKAYVRLRSFQGRSSLSTWLTRVIINSALMIRRRENGRPEASLDELVEGQPEQPQRQIVDAGLNPEQIYRVTEMSGLLMDQIRKLPSGLRTAFQLVDVDGLSTPKSTQELGIRLSALKSRLCRARQRVASGLRQSLRRPRNNIAVAAAHNTSDPDHRIGRGVPEKISSEIGNPTYSRHEP
jgi:RNA polymerase sigma factor (sigma-70 family)